MFSHNNSNQKPSIQSLHTKHGERKYLTEDERKNFIEAANNQKQSVRLLCLVLLLSGCRLSEVLNMTSENVLDAENAILIRSLKKRDKISYRQIPQPHGIISDLLMISRKRPDRLFPWKRTQALNHVKRVMQEAGIEGFRATARGLRHTFGAHGIHCGVPLTLLQRWFGHANIETTAIYTQILGPEEREVAKKMW